MASSEIIEALQRCELFSTLGEEEIEQIATLSEIKTYKAGDTVITQGEYGTKLYLIAEGQVALLRSVNLGSRQGTMTIALLGRGRGVGWSALICEPCSASASAVCQKPSKLVSLEGTKLREMLDARPEVGFQVMERLAYVLNDRLRAAYGAMDTFR